MIKLTYSQNIHLTVMSMECLMQCRQDLMPDPQHDPILMIVYTVYSFGSESAKTGFIFAQDACQKSSVAKQVKFYTGLNNF